MKKWSFVIRSTYTNYIRNIVNNEISDDIFFYSEGSDEDGNLTYYFSSSHLNHLDHPNKVFENGMWLKTIFDGVSYLIHEDKSEYHPLELGVLVKNKTQEIFQPKYRSQQLPFNVNFNANKIERKIQTPGLPQYYECATTEPFLLNIALICSRAMSYRDLYQALDEIKYFLNSVGDDVFNYGISQKKIKNFTHTANSFSAVGIDARHGNDSKTAPPSSPMELNEAQKLISNLIYNVIEKHFNIYLPEIKSFNVDLDDTDWKILDDF